MTAAGHTPTGDWPFRVLVVCTANQCRSPMAEHLLRQASSELGLNWAVTSAGVLARPGLPMHVLAAGTLAERSIRVEGWVSRRLTKPMIDQADVVLTAAAEHRHAVIALDPQATRRTFTLLQFARFASVVAPYASPDPALAGYELLDIVASVRATLQPVEPNQDDLTDPIGKPRRAFRACADRIHDAVDRMLTPLRPV